jgi:hypothetical protein
MLTYADEYREWLTLASNFTRDAFRDIETPANSMHYLLQVYMCPHTAICWYICVLILLYMCPHTAIYVSPYCYRCVVVQASSASQHVSIRQHTSAYVSIRQHTYICVLIQASSASQLYALDFLQVCTSMRREVCSSMRIRRQRMPALQYADLYMHADVC